MGVSITSGVSVNEGVVAAAAVQVPQPLLELPLKSDLSLTHGTGSVTFTRSTTGTYVDPADGLVKTAAINIPRFEANGLLIEGASTNISIRSEEFNDAAWSKGGSSISPNSIVAPDGTLTADALVEGSSSGSHNIFKIPAGAADTYTKSVYVKENTRRYVAVWLFDTGTVSGVLFDSRDGSFVEHLDSANQVTSFSSVALSNGWFRLSITATLTALSQHGVDLSDSASPAKTATKLPTYLGDGVSSLYIWGAQAEALPFASSYIPTTTTAVTRTADSASISSTGNFFETQGSIAVLADVIGDLGADQSIISVNDGSAVDRYLINRSSDKIRTQVIDTSVSQADYSDASDMTVNQQFSIAHTFKANDFETFKDGVSIGTDTAGTVPAGLTDIDLGQDNAGANQMYGHLKNLRIYANVLTADQVRQL